MDETRPLPDLPNFSPTSDDCLFVDGMAVPRRIDDLLILNKIGIGGFGVVMMAERESPKGRVAVKFPRICKLQEGSLRKFSDEADRLSALQVHAGIVAVYRTGRFMCDGFELPYMVMELVDPPLRLMEYVHKHRLDERAKCRLVIQIARAVEHMHDRGIWHRDLKPANILVQSKGQPKIIDVGMAITGDPHRRAQEYGLISGTPEYMAPEQFEPTPDALTSRTDVYALGVILHEVLTDRIPCELRHLDRSQWPEAVRETPPTRPSKYVPLKYPAIDNVVAAALRKETNPDEPSRQHGPKDFADQLEAAIAEPRTTHDPRLERWRKRAVQALVFGALVLGSGLMGDRVARWTGVEKWYEHQLMKTPMPAVRDVPLKNVAVIRFTSDEEPLSVASENGIAGVVAGEVGTYRAIYARLLDKLKSSGALAIVADIHFMDDEKRLESELGMAAQRLGKQPNPIPVYSGLDSWKGTEQRPATNQRLAGSISAGGNSMDEGADSDNDSLIRAWVVDVGLYRRGDFIPGLSIAALGDAREPSLRSLPQIDEDHPAIVIQYFERVSDTKAPTEWLKEDRFPVSSVAVENPTASETTELGIQPGDKIAKLILALPSDDVLNDATQNFQSVFKASDTELRDWFKGKVVFFANTTSQQDDCFETPDGRKLWGVYAHAVAFEQIVTKRFIWIPSASLFWVMVGISGLMGWLLSTSVRTPKTLVLLRQIVFRISLDILVLTAGLLAIWVICFQITRSVLFYTLPFAPSLAFICAVVLVRTGYLRTIRFKPSREVL